MGTQGISSDLVVVTTVASLQQADVFKAILRSAGIEAFIENENTSVSLNVLTSVINPMGIQIRVRSQDLQAAQEALDAGRQASVDLDPVTDPMEDTPDEIKLRDNPANVYAADAFYLSIVSLGLILCLPFAALLYLRARKVAKVSPPANPDRYYIHMLLAGIIIALETLAIAAIVILMAGSDSW